MQAMYRIIGADQKEYGSVSVDQQFQIQNIKVLILLIYENIEMTISVVGS